MNVTYFGDIQNAVICCKAYYKIKLSTLHILLSFLIESSITDVIACS